HSPLRSTIIPPVPSNSFTQTRVSKEFEEITSRAKTPTSGVSGKRNYQMWGSRLTREPAMQSRLFKFHLLPVRVRAGWCDLHGRRGRGEEVPLHHRRLLVAHLDEAVPVPAIWRGLWAVNQLTCNLRGDDVRLFLGKDAGFGQRHAIGQRDLHHIADR